MSDTKKTSGSSVAATVEKPGSGTADMANSYVLYRRLLSYAFVYWGIFLLAFFGMVIVAGAATAFPALLQPLMDESFVNRDPEAIKWIPFALIGIFFFRVIGAFVSMYGMSVIGRNVIRTIRGEMFSKLITLPKSFYDQSTTGELISKFSFDVEQVANAATKAVTVCIRDSLTVIGLMAWMFYLNVTLALVFFVVAPLISIIVVFVSKRFRMISRNIQNSMGDVSRIVEESIKAQLVVKIFGGREYEEGQFVTANNKNRRQNLRLHLSQSLITPIIQLLVACALALIIYLGTQESMKDVVSPGTFVSFIAAMIMLLPPVRSLTTIVAHLQRGIAAAESIFTFLDLKQEHDEGSFSNDSVAGFIEFDHIDYSYQGEDSPALVDINLKIEVGQTVAFVGRSGSGKSTLLNLIPRLYDVSKGVIRLDGTDIREYSLDNLRSHISYVGQDVVLFNDTIEHNIAYGAMKSHSHEEVVAATKLAYAYDFINETSNGFQTMVGERGVVLSGGQRQRIAIARALLNNAPVLILDEATSALDTESERYIQSSLEQLKKDHTTLIIAHRLSTIESADVIVVMDKGKIVETGSHQELLAKNGHYASLHQINFQEN